MGDGGGGSEDVTQTLSEPDEKKERGEEGKEHHPLSLSRSLASAETLM